MHAVLAEESLTKASVQAPSHMDLAPYTLIVFPIQQSLIMFRC